MSDVPASWASSFKYGPRVSCFRALQGVLPHNPLVTHETDTRHLRDASFLGGALRYRVARMLFTLQLRLRR